MIDRPNDRDGGATAGPERRCLVSRESAPKHGLVRFVIGPDGVIVPDVAERLPGRGYWLRADRAVFETAFRRNPFSKVARRAVKVPADLAERTDALIERRLIDTIGLARRAGQAVFGHGAVEDGLRDGALGLVLIAADSSGRDGAAIEGRAGRADVQVCRALDGAALGAAFDRESLVFVGVRPGRLAETATREALRLTGLRATAGPGASVAAAEQN